MKITQYLPNYFDGFRQECGEFSDKKELEGIPFVKSWLNIGFHLKHSVMSSSVLLMACKDETYYVISIVRDNDSKSFIVDNYDKFDKLN